MDLACRACAHRVSAHNLLEGCPFCNCLAAPSEANPVTDVEVMRDPLPDPPRRPVPHEQSGDWSEREWAAARAMRIEETGDTLPPGFAARQWDSGAFGDPQKYLRMARAALQAADAAKQEGAATVNPLEGVRQYTRPDGTEVKK